MRIVEVGQYFMTKDTGDFRQFRSVACPEYTRPRSDESSQPKGWIQGNTRIGPVLEVTTSYMYGKHGIESRIWSVSQDNSHSWVRISHGANKYVVDSNHKKKEIPADQDDEQASHSSVTVMAARSKAKTKPQKREPVDAPSIIPMNERTWIDIEPSEPSLCVRISKNVISLLRHNQTLQREEDGAIQFYRIKFHLRNIPHKYSIGLMNVGNLVWQQEDVRKRDISIAMIIREAFFTSELFKDTLETISLILRYGTM